MSGGKWLIDKEIRGHFRSLEVPTEDHRGSRV